MQELKRIINVNADSILERIPENMNKVLEMLNDNSGRAQSAETEEA